MSGQCAAGACSHTSSTPYHQTIDEVEFERGIWTAALENNVDKMTSLLTKDSGHANKQDGNGYTALHYAARAGHREACKLLLSHGADVNARLRGGDTAMHRASYKGRAGVVELLISHGAEAIQGADGQTPLHKAVEQTQLQTAKLLVESYPHLKVIRDDKQRQPIDLYSGEDVEWLSLLAEG